MSRSDSKRDRIAAIPLFADAGRKAMKNLLEATEEMHRPAGSTIVQQGGFAGQLCVLIEGTAEVSVNGEPVATLGPDDVIGELSFLARSEASATVTATSDCELVAIRYNRLEQILEADPPLVRHLAEVLAKRLLDRNRGQT